MSMMDRREFVKVTAIASASGLLERSSFAQLSVDKRVLVYLKAPNSTKTELAVRELISGLRLLNAAWLVREGDGGERGGVRLALLIDRSAFRGVEEYEIKAAENGVAMYAASEQALLYAVFDFLERQGTVFGIDGTTVPLDVADHLRLPAIGESWNGVPNLTVRGLMPWPDFLNCISVYNDEDFKAYFASMLRMRFNMFGMHVYTQPQTLTESYLSFEFAGSGHRAALDDSTMASWGYLPQRTSTYKMGSAEFFDRETFGADANRFAADNWERGDRTRMLLREALQFAQQIGIRTGVGFEPYSLPAEITEALPPESKSFPGGLVESRIGRDILERRLADLLERYPAVDDVWLWQDEGANWDSRTKEVELSITPFLQAHEFLRRHAPERRLILSGWGYVSKHFESLHKRLPEDIIFSSLDDSFGWDPINDIYGKLGNRERWPISWLEDDASMCLAQFRASRFEDGMERARDLGCQGMLGIHWRHRIVDPTATYFARASWDKRLTSAANYRFYCGALAQGDRVGQLASILEDADRQLGIASTFLGTYNKDSFADTTIVADLDLNDGNRPRVAVLERQRITAKLLSELMSRIDSPVERDRVGYFAGFVEMMVPYGDVFATAHEIGAVLKRAVVLRDQRKNEEARSLVMEKAVPLWIAMAPMVRETMLTYQGIVSTRNDQGQLASMQNKFVRVTLERMRLSIKEFLGELPASMEGAYKAAVSSEGCNTPRLFIPTRPSLLRSGESVRLFLVFPGQAGVTDVRLYSRRSRERNWTSIAAQHQGRSVYSACLGPFQPSDGTIEYYAATSGGAVRLSAPIEAPANHYTLNIFNPKSPGHSQLTD